MTTKGSTVYADAIVARVGEGCRLEHSGGNVFTLTVNGAFSIGPFTQDGRPADEGVSVYDEETGKQMWCESVDAVMATIEEGVCRK